MTMTHRNLLPLCWLGLTLLSACERPAPVSVGAPQPIFEASQIKYPPGHPQLPLLSSQAAQAAQDLVFELPARLVWNEDRTQRITSAFAARISHIHADVGKAVNAGSALATMSSPEFGAAQADAARARADAAVAQKNLDRQQDLFNAGIVARKELEQAQADAQRTQAEVDRAQARVAMYGGGQRVDQLIELRTQMTGVVVERNLNPGQEVRPEAAAPGTSALFVVTDPRELWLLIDAKAEDLPHLPLGQSLPLRVPGVSDGHFMATVVGSNDAIDPVSRVVKVKAKVANPQRLLKAEMIGSVQVQRKLGAGVVVPASAVFLRGTQHVVYVQNQPGVYQSREVVLGHADNKTSHITQGLTPGEMVVTQNVLLLEREFNMAQSAARTQVVETGKAKP
jgi:cobalt-zinc-cadmium efflux system membrane fusion protein